MFFTVPYHLSIVTLLYRNPNLQYLLSAHVLESGEQRERGDALQYTSIPYTLATVVPFFTTPPATVTQQIRSRTSTREGREQAAATTIIRLQRANNKMPMLL